MASVPITYAQADDSSAWPRLCVYCGQTACQHVELPAKHRGRLSRLRVPVCERHFHQPSHLRGFEIIAMVLLAIWIAGNILAVCFTVTLDINDPRNKLGPIFLGLLLPAIPVGIALSLWMAPVRVTEESSHGFTLSGVGRPFAAAWRVQLKRRAAETSLPTETHFEVRPYQPKSVCSLESGVRLYGFSLGLAVVAGIVLGGASMGMLPLVADWANNDIRFLGLIAVCVFGHGAVCLAVVGFPILTGGFRYLVVVAMVLAIVAVLAVAGAGLLAIFSTNQRNTPLSFSFRLAWYGPAFLMIGLFTFSRVRQEKVRHGLIAGLTGLLAPLALLGAALVVTWDTPGFDISIVYIGGFAALGFPWACRLQAGTPYCIPCDVWMIREIVGGLSRPEAGVAELLAEGYLPELASGAACAKPGPDDIELAIYYCAACKQHNELVLEASIVASKTTRGKPLGRWVYPGTAWKQLKNLFPTWPASELPNAGSEPA